MPQPSPSAPRGRERVIPRRAALVGAAVATVAVTGCTSDDGSQADHRASRSPRASSSPSATRPANPDVALAAGVLAAEQQMLQRVSATVRRHRRLGPVLAGARSAHAAHVRLLARAVPDHASAPATPLPAAPQVPVGRVAALQAVARAESTLGARHAREAVAARSGAFARVLASMAAASAQQAAHLTAHLEAAAAAAAAAAARPGS